MRHAQSLSGARSEYLASAISKNVAKICALEGLDIPSNTPSQSSTFPWSDWHQHIRSRLHLSLRSSDEEFEAGADRLGLSPTYLRALKSLAREGSGRYASADTTTAATRYYDLSVLPLTEILGGRALAYCLPPEDYFEPHPSNVADPYGLLWAKTRASAGDDATVGVVAPSGDLLGSHKFPHTILMNVDFYCPVGCSDCYKSRFGTREIADRPDDRLALFTAPSGLQAIPPSAAAVLTQTDELVEWMNNTARGASVYDVVISGGEPLMLSNEVIEGMLDRFAGAKNLRILRVCTGTVFLGLPMRIDSDLVSLFTEFAHNTGVRVTFQVHLAAIEHFSVDALIAVERLRNAGINLYSQIPIKSGINFDPADPQATLKGLARLNHLQVAAGVEPYMYIVDMHPSTRGFYVPIEALIAMWAELVESHNFPGLERPRTLSILAPAGNIILSGPTLALMQKSVDRAAGVVHYTIPRLGYSEGYAPRVVERFSFTEPLSNINDDPGSLGRLRRQLEL